MTEPTEEQKQAEREAKEREAKEREAKGKGSAPAARPSMEADLAQAIKGLRFRTNKAIPVLDDATGQPIVEGGKEKVRYIPDLRPMEVSDVLKAYMADGQLVIVAKDGSKHRLNKGGKAAA